MDIEAINNAINELEGSETTVKNVEELACLYIIHDHLINNRHSHSSISKSPIPSYYRYILSKQEFQKGVGAVQDVITCAKELNTELFQLLNNLYSGSDVPEERQLLQKNIEFFMKKHFTNE